MSEHTTGAQTMTELKVEEIVQTAIAMRKLLERLRDGCSSPAWHDAHVMLAADRHAVSVLHGVLHAADVAGLVYECAYCMQPLDILGEGAAVECQACGNLVCRSCAVCDDGDWYCLEHLPDNVRRQMERDEQAERQRDDVVRQ